MRPQHVVISLKEQFIKEVTVEKTTEQINELETKGGFYTEQEMKDKLNYKPQLILAFDCMANGRAMHLFLVSQFPAPISYNPLRLTKEQNPGYH